MVDDTRAFLTHALRTLDETGAWIRERAGSSFRIDRKPDDSFVTEIDLEVETRIRTAILARWPDHAVLGEEDGATPGPSEYRWIIDPIDGTMSLRCGVPLYGTIVALYRLDEPLVGVIQLPALGRCYWAGLGLGAFLNGVRLELSDTTDVSSEIVAIGDRSQFAAAGMATVFDSLVRAHPWIRTYTDCFGHALAVEGAAGAMLDVDLKEWDVAATKLLVTEAGGRFERLPPRQDDRWDVVFGKPGVVEWIMNELDGKGRLK